MRETLTEVDSASKHKRVPFAAVSEQSVSTWSQGWQLCTLGPVLSHLRECALNSAKEANDKLSSSVIQM